MSDLKKCNQTGCDEPSAFLFTWPGRDQAGICAEHAPKMRAVADAMGCYVQLIPVVHVETGRAGSEEPSN